jgi:hypothetical protein
MVDSYDEKQLVYDLRQIYAVDIIGTTLKSIKIARTSENYPLWYHLLKRDLLTEISQKLEDNEIKYIKDKIERVKQILYKNQLVYLGKGKDPLGHETVEDCLCDLEVAMTKLMEKHKMFGAKEEEEGL